MEGEWSCYSIGHFNEERMVMLQKSPLYWRENGHVTEVANLKEGEWSCYRGGKFNGGSGHVRRWPGRGRMVMLQRWSL